MPICCNRRKHYTITTVTAKIWKSVYTSIIPIKVRIPKEKVTDLEKNLNRRNSGKNKHTTTGLPWNLVYRESFIFGDNVEISGKGVISLANRKLLVAYICSKRNDLNNCEIMLKGSNGLKRLN